jgi:proliferating cell nuclear antigen
MGSSQFALIAVKLDATGFEKYCCDRPVPLGVNLASLTEVFKCAKDADFCTGDVLNLVYEPKSEYILFFFSSYNPSNDLDPNTRADARLPSRWTSNRRVRHETNGHRFRQPRYPETPRQYVFGRILPRRSRSLSLLGESVRIEVSTEGIRLASDGETADGNMLLKEANSTKGKYKDYGVHGEASQTKMDNDDKGG